MIGYRAHEGLRRKQRNGRRHERTILRHDERVIQVSTRDVQALVDAVAKALGR